MRRNTLYASPHCYGTAYAKRCCGLPGCGDRLPPNQGRGDFVDLVQALDDIGYDGLLSMGIGFSYRSAQPDQFARETYEFMRPLLDVSEVYREEISDTVSIRIQRSGLFR